MRRSRTATTSRSSAGCILRGRCRACGEPFSWRYPAVELLTGVLFAAVVATHDEAIDLVLGLLLVTALVPIALIDLDVRKIPNVITLPASILALAAGLALDIDFVPEQLIAGAAAFAFFFLAAWLYPRGMGMGDVKLAGMLGLYLGRAVAPAIFLALILGVRRRRRRHRAPGPEGRTQGRRSVRPVPRGRRHLRVLRGGGPDGRVPRPVRQLASRISRRRPPPAFGRLCLGHSSPSACNGLHRRSSAPGGGGWGCGRLGACSGGWLMGGRALAGRWQLGGSLRFVGPPRSRSRFDSIGESNRRLDVAAPTCRVAPRSSVGGAPAGQWRFGAIAPVCRSAQIEMSFAR